MISSLVRVVMQLHAVGRQGPLRSTPARRSERAVVAPSPLSRPGRRALDRRSLEGFERAIAAAIAEAVPQAR